ncbi:MAG: ATP-binding protein [Pseudomonadota bacterium]
MSSNEHTNKQIKYLEERIEYLEEVNRFTLDALEMAASIGDFQESINKLQEPSLILHETRIRINRLIQFQATAFFVVDETNRDFVLFGCEPQDYAPYLQGEMDFLIEDGTFSWTLRERRPIIISTKNQKKRLLLHVMATHSRVRGMFMGLLEQEQGGITDVSLSLLSTVLLNSSNAMESFELYKMIREITENLEKKENYRTLFDAAPDGVEVLDGRGHVVDCNRAHELLVGHGRGKIVGRHTTAFFSERSRSSYERKSMDLRQTGYAEGEIELVRADGSITQVWRKERVIYDSKKELVGSIIYNRDISDLKRAEREKMTLQRQLQMAEKMKAIGTLAGGVAHDLNNVLVGLVSYPDLLLMDLPKNSPLSKGILTIKKSGQKAEAIVQDLLTLARRGVAVEALVDLNQVIFEYLISPEFVKLKEFNPGVQVKFDHDPNLLNIMGSPVHLSKTVMNLVSNAAEAMADGGIVTIKTENRKMDHPVEGYDEFIEGEYVVLTVSDTGVGIRPEDRERIFEPFYTKKVMGRSGTGLGMAVVWGTVKDHRGHIDVKSDLGKGTTFTVYFPATREQMKKEETENPVEDYMGRGETVLVVDDVEDQREIACNILRRLGYSVAAAPSGEEALEYMKNNSADLLVLDMIMDPGMDGLETLKRVLNLNPTQKAIITSGLSESDRVKEAQRLGANAYIKKPYLLERFGTTVRSVLDR